jgi:hypothetical protein
VLQNIPILLTLKSLQTAIYLKDTFLPRPVSFLFQFALYYSDQCLKIFLNLIYRINVILPETYPVIFI